MRVGSDFPNVLMRKIIKVLVRANYPMTFDDIYDELVKAGHPTSLTSDVGPFTLHACVNNYIKTELRKGGIIREINNGLVYLPRAVFRNLEDCAKHHSQFTENHPIGYVYHIEQILNLLKSEPDILSWAKNNQHNTDPEIKYYSYLFLIDSAKTSKYVSEALADSNYRVNCLGIFNIANSTKVNMRKVVKLIEDEDYMELISSISIPNDIFLNAYANLAKSDEIESAKIGIRGLMIDRRLESLPKLIDAFEEMEIEIFLEIFTEDYMNAYVSFISEMSSDRGQYPDTIKRNIIKLCSSENPSSQRLAFLAMKKKWLKSDLDVLENIKTDNNPIATGLKLEAIYRKKSSNRLAIAKLYLDSTQIGIRNAAVEILGDSGSAPERKLLMAIFKDETKQNNYDIAILIEAIKKLQ